MTKNSLELIDTRLARRVERESPRRLRKIAVAVSRLALDCAGLRGSPVLTAALDHIEAEEPLPAPLKEALTKLAEDLDEEYFSALAKVETGKLEADAVYPLFNRARAAAAVVFAGYQDAFEAATQSSYEAWAALGEDTVSLRKAIMRILDEADATRE